METSERATVQLFPSDVSSSETPAPAVIATDSAREWQVTKVGIRRSRPPEALFPAVVIAMDHHHSNLVTTESSRRMMMRTDISAAVAPNTVDDSRTSGAVVNVLFDDSVDGKTTVPDAVQQLQNASVSDSSVSRWNISGGIEDDSTRKAKYSDTSVINHSPKTVISSNYAGFDLNYSTKPCANVNVHTQHINRGRRTRNCAEYDVNDNTKPSVNDISVCSSSSSGTGNSDVCSTSPWLNKRPQDHDTCGSSKWLRIVKPGHHISRNMDSDHDCWPPLGSACCRSAFKIRDDESQASSSSSPFGGNIKPVETSTTNYLHNDGWSLSSYYDTSNQGNMAMVLDEQCWPALGKSGTSVDQSLEACNRISNHDNLQAVQIRPSGSSSTSENNNLQMPPVFLMVNKDFIVTSPLKESLLLTLALAGKRSLSREALPALNQSCQGTQASPVDQGESSMILQRQQAPPVDQGESSMIMRRQILVGQFKAVSSFLHFVLGRDAMRVRTESNAGGTSTISESLSVEYFVRRFKARDIVTEMEVEYRAFNWKKVDYICTLYGQRVGVSVTRAMSFPDPKDFTHQMAYRLLYKKLFGLVVARHGVSDRHSFSQCILHVWCETQETASIMEREYEGVSQELDIADDVVMVLTVADGWRARPIFYESTLHNNRAPN